MLFICTLKSLIWKSSVKKKTQKWSSCHERVGVNKDHLSTVEMTTFRCGGVRFSLGSVCMKQPRRQKKEGEDPGRAVIRQAERNHIRYTIRNPPSPFLQTSPIMSKLSCDSKYSPLWGLKWQTEDIVVYPRFFSPPVKGKPSDSKRSTCVPLKSIYFKDPIPPPSSSNGRITVNTLKSGRRWSAHPTIFFIDEGFLCKLGLSRDPHQVSPHNLLCFLTDLVECWAE